MLVRIIKDSYFIFFIIMLSLFLFNILSYNYFIKNYIYLENKENKKIILNLINKIDSNLDNLKVITKDYSIWDNTYDFINDKNEEYIYDNFRENSSTLENIYLDFMIFVNTKEEVVFSVYSKYIKLDDKKSFEKNIIQHDFNKTKTTIINYKNQYFYLTKADILKTDLTGKNRGYIYSGRIFNLDKLNKIFFNKIQLTNNPIKNIDTVFNSNFIDKITANFTYKNNNLINILNFYDNNKNHIFTLDLLNSRELYKEGQHNIILFNMIISLALLIIYFIFYLYLSYQLKLNKQLEIRIRKEVEKSRQKENLLIQQAKLASMGEMINNIAHQWRQPLNALSLVTQNINFSYQSNDLNDEFMKKSMEKSNLLISSMSKTIDDFRNFFKPNKTKTLFDVRNSVEKTLDLINSTLEFHQITLKKDFSSVDLTIFSYENEFSQVLLNIITNAKDALLSDEIKNPEIIISTFSENNFAIVKIKDNAKGINKGIINKIFEPYFTTKEKNDGTGIGLYMSKTIIEKNMEGKLEVISSSKGTEFIIKIILD